MKRQSGKRGDTGFHTMHQTRANLQHSKRTIACSGLATYAIVVELHVVELFIANSVANPFPSREALVLCRAELVPIWSKFNTKAFNFASQENERYHFGHVIKARK